MHVSPQHPDGPPGRRRWDHFLGGLTAALFSVALGFLSLSVPLYAIALGYSGTEIGVLVALSAVSQLASRLCMSAMMRRVPDKVFVIGAGVLIAASCLLLALSPQLPAFVLSQLIQGVARALFWTGSQTHAVRMATSPVGALTIINLAAGLGSLVGPVLAGYITERSIQTALFVGTFIGLTAVIPAGLLARLPVLEVGRSDAGAEAGWFWRRPGVEAGCWMGASAGAWRGLLNSYIPVVLAHAAQSAFVIGILISVANGALLLGTAVSGWVRRSGVGRSLVLSVIPAAAGIAAVGPLAGLAVPAGFALALSGVGAGLLQTIGPAVASESVHPEEKGDAIASAGSFRAAALFAAPLGMAGLTLFVSLNIGLLLAGALMALPALAARRPGPAS